MNNRTYSEIMCLPVPLLIYVAIIKTAKCSVDTLSLKKNNVRAQRGSVLTLTAASLLALMGFMGLALDVGYVYMVRNELQDAADAAALAGAGQLFSGSSSIPDFTVGSAAASSAITNLNNQAANAALVTGTITTGYWDLTGSTIEVHTSSLSANDFPAVKVQITKSGTNGAVNSFFSKALGINTFNPTATAVAVVTGPGKGNLFPMVLSQCLFDTYYGSNGPLKATSTKPLSNQDNIKQTIGQPYIFAMDSGYPAGTGTSKCKTGQWSSYNLSSDTTTISNMIAGTQINSMAIGDNFSTKVTTANSTTLTNAAAANCSSGEGNTSCGYMLVPVIDDSAMGSVSTNPIKNLACLHIIGKESSGKYIKAQLVAADDSNCKFPASSGYGPISYGAVQPPRLVNYWGNTY